MWVIEHCLSLKKIHARNWNDRIEMLKFICECVNVKAVLSISLGIGGKFYLLRQNHCLQC
jgi:hypothetical protein